MQAAVVICMRSSPADAGTTILDFSVSFTAAGLVILQAVIDEVRLEGWTFHTRRHVIQPGRRLKLYRGTLGM